MSDQRQPRMSRRLTVPPRREELVAQYEAANFHAIEAYEAAQELIEGGRMALAMRPDPDFRSAHSHFEEALAALVDAKRHRQAEYDLRAAEVKDYAHLDDDWTAKDLKLAANYCARRIVRIRTAFDVTHIQACIAHIDHKITNAPRIIEMLERKKMEENLHQRIKMEGQRPGSFGSAWGGSQFGDRRVRVHLSEAGERLRDLDWQINNLKNSVPKLRLERTQNEEKWAKVRKDMKHQDATWKPLDIAARRHHAGLPPLDPPPPSKTSRRNLKDVMPEYGEEVTPAELWQQQREWEEAAGLHHQSEADPEDDANLWEAEYGAAADENDAYTASSLPGLDMDDTTLQYSNLFLGSKSPDRKTPADLLSPRRPDARESSIQTGWATGLQQSKSPLPSTSGYGGGLDTEGWEAAWTSHQVKREEVDSMTSWNDSSITKVNRSATVAQDSDEEL